MRCALAGSGGDRRLHSASIPERRIRRRSEDVGGRRERACRSLPHRSAAPLCDTTLFFFSRDDRWFKGNSRRSDRSCEKNMRSDSGGRQGGGGGQVDREAEVRVQPARL